VGGRSKESEMERMAKWGNWTTKFGVNVPRTGGRVFDSYDWLRQ
jgi:hypothetical protein